MNNANKPIGLDIEAVSRILVYAFGAFDRYYICWQDKSGKFHQDGHNLPKELHEWLFPESGRTRDFETLQVTLLHADEFCAYDKDDKITNLRSSRESLHRRSAPDQLMIKDDGRRACTEPPPQSDFQAPMLLRRQTYTANGDVRQASRRSRSLASVSFTRRWSLNTAASRALPTVPSASPATPSEVSQAALPNKVAAPRYADASVQTEAYEAPPSSDDGSSVDDCVSTTSSSMYQLTPEICRSNVDLSFRARHNPVRIGAMSMFFRTPGYRLGDALL